MNDPIEPLTTHDLGQLSALQPKGWGDITPAYTTYLGAKLYYPVKVVSDGQMVGVGTGITFGKTAWLAHVIVHRKYQRRGIGRGIVEHLITLLEKLGCESISLIATSDGRPVYAKAGFTEQTDYVFFERRQMDIPYTPSQSIDAITENDLADILHLDRDVSGETRQDHLNGSWSEGQVYRRDGIVAGYYLPHAGSGLVIAADDDAGIALMNLRVRTEHAAVLPAENRAGIEFLLGNGFTETNRVKRMIYGRQFPWRPSNLYNRISGNVG